QFACSKLLFCPLHRIEFHSHRHALSCSGWTSRPSPPAADDLNRNRGRLHQLLRSPSRQRRPPTQLRPPPTLPNASNTPASNTSRARDVGKNETESPSYDMTQVATTREYRTSRSGDRDCGD